MCNTMSTLPTTRTNDSSQFFVIEATVEQLKLQAPFQGPALQNQAAGSIPRARAALNKKP